MKSKRITDRFVLNGKDKLLGIFIKARTGKALDKAVDKSRDYQDALKRQEIAFDNMDKSGLSREQKRIVDRAISAANDCGAVYGVAAYRLGIHDGIKVMSEIKEF